MTVAAWAVVAALFAGTVVLKAVGPVTFGGRRLSARAAAVIGLVAPSLLAALVVYETLSADGRGIAIDARVAGLAAAGVAIALRRSMIVVVIVAAATAAAVRAVV
jgi:branched chain amino acid efflux pump